MVAEGELSSPSSGCEAMDVLAFAERPTIRYFGTE